MKRHTETAVRAAHCVQRIAEELRKALKGTQDEGLAPTFLLILCNGYFSTGAGEGDLYDEFVRDKHLPGNYSGRNYKPRDHNDAIYRQSRMQLMSYDHAFTHCTTDVQDSM